MFQLMDTSFTPVFLLLLSHIKLNAKVWEREMIFCFEDDSRAIKKVIEFVVSKINSFRLTISSSDLKDNNLLSDSDTHFTLSTFLLITFTQIKLGLLGESVL